MSVNSYLQNLASELVLSSYEKDHVATSLDAIKSRLSLCFGNEVKEKKVFGSYDRETILPRKADEKSDIDLMVVFDNLNNYKPQTYLNKLKSFAERYYSSSEIYQSNPTIVLELQHIKFELTPAYRVYGLLYYIPRNQSEWMITDPDGFSNTLVECNKNNGSKIKPVVRLLKHWNIQKNLRDIASFELEKTIANDLMYEYYASTTYVDYVKAGLGKIKYKTDYSKVNTAIEQINKAISFEDQGKPYSALEEIKKAFPEI